MYRGESGQLSSKEGAITKGLIYANMITQKYPIYVVEEIQSIAKGSRLKKQNSLNMGIAQIGWTPPPPSNLGSRGALLRVNRDIFQNATKQRKIPWWWPLEIYHAIEHWTFFQPF